MPLLPQVIIHAVGYAALSAATTGHSSTANGTYSLELNCTTGVDNVAIGDLTLDAISTGSRHTAVGAQCLTAATTGEHNCGLGLQAGLAVTTGNSNVVIGVESGREITTGSNNICIGVDSGRSNAPSGSISTSSHNICLGNNSINNLFCADTSISSSDSRDKTDIADFTKGLDWVKALRPVTYRWDRRTWYGTDAEPYGTPDGSKKRARLHIGFLAQEALEVEKANGYGSSNDDSLVVNLTEDGMSYGMKYERLVPILVNAIKELSTKNTALETRVAALEAA